MSWLRPSFHGIGSETSFRPDGAAPDSPEFDSDENRVAPGFFETVGLPIVAGRDFSPSESGPLASSACRCVVLTESLARRAFGAGSPVGRQLIRRGLPPTTVIGIVRDTRQRHLLAPNPDMVFDPFVPNDATTWVTVVVRLAAPMSIVAPGVRQAVAAVDPTLPLYDVMRVDDAIRAEFADGRLLMLLARVFAALATAVAAIGLAGMLARSIAERRRELGIRVALGATPGGVARLVLAEAGGVLAAGLAIGLAACPALAGLLAAQLYGVGRLDLWSMAAGTLVVALVTTASALLAGRRAGRVDGTEALRA
jgi:ABC-type antimicrobial peptide transport system permease subunit